MIVWFTPLNDVGQEALDLSKCRRFVVSKLDYDNREDGLAYYFAKGINKNPDRWICHSQFHFMDFEGVQVSDSWSECHPEEVVNVLLSNKTYGEKLPKDLANMREHGDSAYHEAWKRTSGIEPTAVPGGPRPAWIEQGNSRRLSYNGRLVKEFKKNNAPQQFCMLRDFDNNGWSKRILNPLRTTEELINTTKSMSNLLSPLKFTREGDWVRWSVKVSEASSKNKEASLNKNPGS